ncbi:hypothetical protein BC567DRAFT_284620 [Phyllosticta citribraziliensis]
MPESIGPIFFDTKPHQAGERLGKQGAQEKDGDSGNRKAVAGVEEERDAAAACPAHISQHDTTCVQQKEQLRGLCAETADAGARAAARSSKGGNWLRAEVDSRDPGSLPVTLGSLPPYLQACLRVQVQVVAAWAVMTQAFEAAVSAVYIDQMSTSSQERSAVSAVSTKKKKSSADGSVAGSWTRKCLWTR